MIARYIYSKIDWPACEVTEFYQAYNANDARKILSEHWVDIILCDIEMPGENGIELIRWVRSKGLEPAVIFLTCHAKFEYAQEAVRLKCEDYILVPASYQVITDKIKQVVKKLKQSQTERAGERHPQLEKLLLPVKEEEDLNGFRNMNELVREIELYIVDNISNVELSRSYIARVFFLNKDYLSRSFKEIKGITVQKYIVGVRMEIAVQLMIKERLSLEVIASRVGYSNYAYFAASFKKAYNCTPKQYLTRLGS